jgi:hypothetical protein
VTGSNINVKLNKKIMTKKMVHIGAAILFGIALIFNVSINPFSIINDIGIVAVASTSSSVLICTAKVDCDLVIGGSYVKCYNYNPEGTCQSFPLLHKVTCDGRTSWCTN